MAHFYPATTLDLIDAINDANSNGEADTIHLDGGVYPLSSVNDTGDFGDVGLPAITSAITIEGNGATIQRSPASALKLMWIKSISGFGPVVLRDLTFRDGLATATKAAGALMIENATVTITRCHFIDNAADDHGGAIYVLGVIGPSSPKPVLTIDECHFSGNISGDLGGGLRILSNRPVYINQCTFNNNHGTRGGAIANGTGTLYITKSEFLSNQATSFYGGAIENAGDTLLISDSNFQQNTAQSDGGAIASINGVLRLQRCLLTGNIAQDNAGAIQATGTFFDITESTLANNLGNGGVSAIQCSTPEAKIYSCEIVGHSGIAVSSPVTLDARFNYWGAANGPSGAGPGSGDAISANVLYSPWIGVAGPTEHLGAPACPISYAGSDGLTSGNPISLGSGEKRLDETNIRLNTPLGELSFSRRYRQSQQAELNFMGLGWTHDHNISLSESGGSPNKITVFMAGNSLIFYDNNADNLFEAAAGSASKILKDGSGYHLTASDESIYHFNTSKQLVSRNLPNGEVWSYSYNSGKLSEVTDGYGRKLKFLYYSGETGLNAFKNNLLKRVGTQTSVDLANNPQVPYVELNYGDDGSGKGLLTSFQDTRGKVWSYRYYGSEPDETDVKWLNFLVERRSPNVDWNGDGSPDSTLLLEALAYEGPSREEITSIEQERGEGKLVNSFNFDPEGRSTIETTSERSTNHSFVNGVYVGSTNPAEQRTSEAPQDNYRSGAQIDANGNITELSWTADGKKLTAVKDALNQSTSFAYDYLDRLFSSSDAEGKLSLYSYASSQRQPSAIRLIKGTNLVYNGNMELDSSWTAILGTAPTTNERHSSFYAGSYSRRVVASAANQGIESVGMALLQGKTYQILAHVRPVSGQAKMALSSSNKLSAAGGAVWEVLSMSYTPAANETISLQFRAEGGAAEFYVDEVFVWAAETVLRWQELVYDNKGRTLEDKLIDPKDGASLLQRSLRTYGTSGNENGLLRTTVQKNVQAAGVGESTTTYDYDAQGRIIKTSQSSLMGNCQFSYMVYDAAGNVLGTACGLHNQTPAPSDLTGLLALYDANDSVKKHTRISTHVYDEMGRRVQTTSNAGMSTARSSRTIYDALSRVVRTIGNYVPQGSSAPGDWVWSSTNLRWEYSASSSTPVSHGTNLDENIIGDTAYNERGLVYLRRDVLGRVNLSGYDLADRLVKSIQNASQPHYNASYLNGDPALANYVPNSTASDLDIITEQAYDAAGNLVKSIDARGAVHFTVYDALNRPVKTVQNAKATATIALNPGDSGYSAANDPRSASYAISTDPDRDMISETVYDALGRVQSSKRLLENRGASPVWDESYFVYDGQGRQVRQVQHYVATNPVVTPENWVYESGIWKTGAGGAAISHGANEQNLISETVYYPDGKLKETLDVQRRLSRMVYDGLGRQFITVSNFVAQPTEPENWSWSATNNRWEYSTGNAVSHGAKLDENIIQETEYDADGRVLESRSVDGLLQRNAYDSAGRQALSISNYVTQGASNPVNWLWDASDGRWEDGAGNAIARGSDFDQNIISQPTYDSEGRAFQNRDARGNLSRQVYDESGRVVLSVSNFLAQATEPENWVFETGNWKTQAGGTVISHGSNNDQNRLQGSSYDILGRAFSSRDSKGRETRRIYDALGRTLRTIGNYIQQGSTNPANWLWNESLLRWEDGAGNAIAHGSAFDQNLISETVYNKAGQVLASRDARGTETSFAYDQAGRRLSMTTAARTAQASTTYSCYDKAGRTLRTIQGYVPPTGSNPDAWSAGNWLFAPAAHGYHSDENCITTYVYDKASRRISTTDPLGYATQSSYSLDGQILSLSDPLSVVTAYRYDKRSRRILVLQNYVANSEDPGLWLWDPADGRYEQSTGAAIAHGTNNDENIIVQLEYDIAGRVIKQREPRGHLTTYSYDKLGRRKSLSNPLSKVWGTSYSEANGASQTTLSYPNGYSLVQDFDRFGRSLQLDYDLASNTPKVNFSHDILGNRLSMIENNGSVNIRQSLYSYDTANRLTSVGFDKDGGGTVDETVSYEYDTGGLRTKLTLPGNLSVTYTYDRKGRLMTLTDWDNQCTEFTFDRAERHVRTRRYTGLDSLYQHDAAGRLRALHHLEGAAGIEQSFIYTVDGRGNRTKAQELKPRTSGAAATTMDHLYAGIVYRGDWRDVGSYHEASNHDASLSLLFYGNTGIELRMGQGPDYSIYDVYIDGTLWQSFDGYAASEGERIIAIPLDGSGLHLLEVKNMREKRLNSNGYKIRFKSLYGQPAFDILTIDYSYDGLARLLSANYSVGADYVYGYDLSGNLVNNNGESRTYNAANQMTSDGTNSYDYDNNGNLWKTNSVISHTWDRANRLLSMGSSSYKYDGAGSRIQQTVSSVVTDYLNDLQPGLVKLLAETTSGNTSRYVHAPRGIHAMEDNAGAWFYYIQDGLGSVRNGDLSYSPMGVPGAAVENFGFTGEYTDTNNLLYLRARYYNPGMGLFTALDPFEGKSCTPMSLNAYAYVYSNPINMIDPTGATATNYFCGVSPWATPWLKPTQGKKFYQEINQNSSNILNATILIELGRNEGNPADAPCRSLASESVENNSLGTLTGYGLWTHDHFRRTGTGEEDPANQEEAIANIKSYECVKFTGSNGNITLPTQYLIFNTQRRGILLIPPFLPLINLGQSPLLFSLGSIIPVCALPSRLEPTPANGIRVGNSAAEIRLDDESETKRAALQVQSGTLQELNFDIGRTDIDVMVSGYQTWGGDSGGGLFVNNSLAGVLARGYGSYVGDLGGLPVDREDNVYTPIEELSLGSVFQSCIS